MAYKVPPLRFAYDALEPDIDAQTMELHHDGHGRAASRATRARRAAQTHEETTNANQ